MRTSVPVPDTVKHFAKNVAFTCHGYSAGCVLIILQRDAELPASNHTARDPVTKTKVIFKAEQGQEPWMAEGEKPRWHYPEVSCLLDDILERQEGIF
ncbi:hypothetical protein VULLAG_LOCUS12211 [Vulpes lagopus]